MIMFKYGRVPLVLDNMVRYWYCANIPPRPLDDKEVEKGRVGEKYGYLGDGRNLWNQ
jgi:hypothetical protein